MGNKRLGTIYRRHYKQLRDDYICGVIIGQHYWRNTPLLFVYNRAMNRMGDVECPELVIKGNAVIGYFEFTAIKSFGVNSLADYEFVETKIRANEYLDNTLRMFLFPDAFCESAFR